MLDGLLAAIAFSLAMLLHSLASREAVEAALEEQQNSVEISANIPVSVLDREGKRA